MNLNYILHEFLADWANFFAQRGGEHHDLLAMRSITENFLNVAAHICIRMGEGANEWTN